MSSTVQKPLRIRRVNHSDEIVSGFSKLLKSESMTDVTLICNGGQTIRAHRVILSTFSSYFKSIFESQPFNTNSCQYPVIVIKDLSFNELRTVVEFIYRGEVSVSQDKLYSILQAGKALDVSGLSDLKCDNHINSNTKNTTEDNGMNPLTSLNISVSGINENNNWKRGQETLDEFNSSELEPQFKKSRISLDSRNYDNVGLSLLGDSGLGSDNVRSLLQHASRLSAMENLKAGLQIQYNQLQKSSRSNLSLEQLFQQKQRTLLQQKLRQQQNQLKNQILQQQLTSKTPGKLVNGNKNGSSFDDNFMQFQEKIKAQINEKQKLASVTNIQDRLTRTKSPRLDSEQQRKPLSDEEIICPDEGDQEIGENSSNKDGNNRLKSERNDEDEKDSSVKSEDNNSNSTDSGRKPNGDVNGKSDDDKEESVNMKEEGDDDDYPRRLKIDQGDEKLDVTEIMEEDEEIRKDDDYGMDIEKDKIFQRQQELRLQQLQKQQQFQNQLQLQLQQEQQEAKLLELQQQIQRANTPNEPEDLSANLSLDWQEGFVDVSFPSISTIGDNMLTGTEKSLALWVQSQNGGQSKIRETNTTVGPTPDFLLPRGPGRPRKGNKAQDISPCPECNKVFVRPDVLKLHYRSVHLNERHPCNMCPKIFKWPGDLSKHKRTKHREAMAMANCQTPINVTSN